jgi:hypothetical protein
MCQLLVTASVVPSSPILVTLMKETLNSSEMSVLTRAMWRNISEDDILHMKVNFSTFPCQHNHHISKWLNHSGQFWRNAEEQSPTTSISVATCTCCLRRMVQNSSTGCSKLVCVHSKKTAAVLKASVVQKHLNIEMCLRSIIFPLFFRTPVHY